MVLGKGSTLLVCLSVIMEPLSVPQQPNQKSEKTSHTYSLRILIVDDDHDSVSILGTLLRLMGNDIRTAHDGLEAVEEAKKFQPDLILLDISLPMMNGYEVAQKIRQQSWGKGIVLIAMTGWGQEEDRCRSKEAGFDHHLVKPVEGATLRDLLARITRTTEGTG
jgi:CheY-like chemotaxis protein